MERDKTVTASFTTAFWIAPSASSLWLPQNDLNLQIVQSLFLGLCTTVKQRRKWKYQQQWLWLTQWGDVSFWVKMEHITQVTWWNGNETQLWAFILLCGVYGPLKQLTLPIILFEVVAYAFYLKMIAWRLYHFIPFKKSFPSFFK